MSGSAGEVARPTLRVRGLLGQAEPILITGGRAVADYREAFVGIDVAKLRNAIAIADSGRGRSSSQEDEPWQIIGKHLWESMSRS